MAETGPISVLGISGSLRRGSFNTATLRAAQELAPDDVRIETFDIAPIPPFNADVLEAGYPPVVSALRERVRAADAVLIVTPEYNYSIPGMLKNALDWVSRPPDQPFKDKPVALMGASPGGFGTVRAQQHLRQVFVFLDAHVLAQPEVMIANAAGRFDAAGRLTDQATRTFISNQLVALRDWTRRLAR